MKKFYIISILVIITILLIGCVKQTPPPPPEPGEITVGGLVGQAVVIVGDFWVAKDNVDTVDLPYGTFTEPGKYTDTKTPVLDYLSTDSIQFTVNIIGTTGSPIDWIWKDIRIVKPDTSTEIIGSFGGPYNNNWVEGNSAQATLTIDKNNYPGSNNKLLIYTCSDTATGFDCHGQKWGLQDIIIKTNDLAVNSIEIDYNANANPVGQSPVKVDVELGVTNKDAKYFDDPAETDDGVIPLRFYPARATTVVTYDGNQIPLVSGWATINLPVSLFSENIVTIPLYLTYDYPTTTTASEYTYYPQAEINPNEKQYEFDGTNNKIGDTVATHQPIVIGVPGQTPTQFKYEENPQIPAIFNVSEAGTITFKIRNVGDPYLGNVPLWVDLSYGINNKVTSATVGGQDVLRSYGRFACFNVPFTGQANELSTVNLVVTYGTTGDYKLTSQINYKDGYCTTAYTTSVVAGESDTSDNKYNDPTRAVNVQVILAGTPPPPPEGTPPPP